MPAMTLAMSSLKGHPATPARAGRASFLVKEFDFVHLSAGDLLREERGNPSSQYGELISSYIKEGKIVPVEITVNLLLNAMNKSSKSGRSSFLVDGFPRNADNIEGWERVVGDKASVLGCLYLDCPESVMESRLLERDKTSGRTDE
jgi:UMP-CMP kinase